MKRNVLILLACVLALLALLARCAAGRLDDQTMSAKPVIYLYPESPCPEGGEPAGMDAKPVVYLYPKADPLEVTVKLHYSGELTCTYPAYNGGWHVLADPDGTLHDAATGAEYSYLFWEGTDSAAVYDMSQGFVVPGEDTAAFLQEKLALLGLTPKEYNEFIVYWLPQMQDHPYNLITFQTGAYTDRAVLEVDPQPDTVLRVFMVWKALDQPVELPEPELAATQRTGFTLVEWGGAQVR